LPYQPFIPTDGYATLKGDAAMRLRPLSRPSAALALWTIGSSLVPLPAFEGWSNCSANGLWRDRDFSGS
jgi:hypothetical protein